VLPILLTALLAVISFLVMQILGLKSEISDLRVCESQHYGKLSKDIGIQEIIVRNLSSKIDRITVTVIRGDEEP